ncbi:hypothetical protein LY78DRAFT_696025 [Colletotrichum sublineola]|nr:hypothetical protein LY78DRAFT_696025 [Colletotrichum sublineola]
MRAPALVSLLTLSLVTQVYPAPAEPASNIPPPDVAARDALAKLENRSDCRRKWEPCFPAIKSQRCCEGLICMVLCTPTGTSNKETLDEEQNQFNMWFQYQQYRYWRQDHPEIKD